MRVPIRALRSAIARNYLQFVLTLFWDYSDDRYSIGTSTLSGGRLMAISTTSDQK
jgi:hypothetical protein